MVVSKKNYAKKFIGWHNVRAIGNSVPAKTTILVPLVGYLIILNTHIVEAMQLYPELCSTEKCDVLSGLYYLYFGCVLISAGQLIYEIRCPGVVKRHSSAEKFFEREKEFYRNHANLRLIFDYYHNNNSWEIEDPEYLETNIVDKKATIADEHVSTLGGIMGRYYEALNRSRALARYSSFILYVFGIGIILIPAVRTFLAVSALLFGFSI